MVKPSLATHYHLEVYENSLVNDPSFNMDSSTPFTSLTVGDYFNHRVADCWQDPPETGKERFVISEIEHIFWTIEGSHNSQKLMVVLQKVAHDE